MAWLTIKDLAHCAIGPFDSKEAAQVHLDYLHGNNAVGSGDVEIVTERPAEEDIHYWLTPQRSQEMTNDEVLNG